MDKQHIEKEHRHPVVMVIDDNPANLNYIANILSVQGYRVRAFPSGRLAFNSAEQNPPDIILLDVDMPDLNGYEVCALFKSNKILNDIPVIFISALTNTKDKIKAFESGGVDYITKPFESEEIKARIQIHLSLAKTTNLEREIRKRISTEQRYYGQLDSLSDSIIHINQNGNIVYCNPVTEKHFGYTKDELVGQKIEILIPENQRKHHLRHREKYLEAPTTRIMTDDMDVFVLKKNGETLPVDISLSTLYSEEGLLVSAEIRDITERVQLKNEIEIQRQFIDDAFSKTPDGIMLIDTDNLIMLTNPSLGKMLGYKPGELIGKHTSLLFENRDEFSNNPIPYSDEMSELKNYARTIHFICKDKSTLPAEISIISVKDKSGGENGHFFMIRDISERIQMENEREYLGKQLLQTQKMEAMGQLTGGVAHDFNNILASIMGFTELSLDLLEEDKDPGKHAIQSKFSDYLNEIHTAGTRAKILIEQMLTFSRTGDNSTLESLHIDRSITEVIKLLRPTLPTSISINLNMMDNTPEIMANPVQVQQILMNICINARDAMENKGTIDICLNQHVIKDEVCTACHKIFSGNYLELTIEDNGPGIEKNLIEHLFEPFFTTKKDGKGTGMGLAMVHGIIHHHHGHVIVESEPGLGTRFRIVFPTLTGNDSINKQAVKETIEEQETV